MESCRVSSVCCQKGTERAEGTGKTIMSFGKDDLVHWKTCGCLFHPFEWCLGPGTAHTHYCYYYDNFGLSLPLPAPHLHAQGSVPGGLVPGFRGRIK